MATKSTKSTKNKNTKSNKGSKRTKKHKIFSFFVVFVDFVAKKSLIFKNIGKDSMKLLITGGAGFIGSAVIRHIITNTIDEVVNLDKLTYAGNLESLAEVSHNERYTFEQADICNRPEVDRILAQHQPDAIMHLAAESHVDRSIAVSYTHLTLPTNREV